MGTPDRLRVDVGGDGVADHAAEFREEAADFEGGETFVVLAHFEQFDRVTERGSIHGLQVFDEIHSYSLRVWG